MTASPNKEVISIGLSWRRIAVLIAITLVFLFTTASMIGAQAGDGLRQDGRKPIRVVVPIIDLTPLAADVTPEPEPVLSEPVALVENNEVVVASVPMPPKAPPAREEPTEQLAALDNDAADVTAFTPPPVIAAPAWQRHAVSVALNADRPKIAIVIDDLGLSRSRTTRSIALPAPLTLAFLPYAKGLELQAAQARQAGHELLVHMPMEPLDRNQDPGPRALTVDLSTDEVLRRLRHALGKFDGYVGINNHMGSRFTSDAQSMLPVLNELKKRGLMFLDSQTSPRSVAGDLAESLGLPSAKRSVFLDHELHPDAIRRSLRQLEAVARHTGSAVGIGHPHGATLDALREWLPDLEARGFQLVPISAIAKLRAEAAQEQVAARTQ